MKENESKIRKGDFICETLEALFFSRGANFIVPLLTVAELLFNSFATGSRIYAVHGMIYLFNMR